MKTKTFKGMLSLMLVALFLVTSLGFASTVCAEEEIDVRVEDRGVGTLNAHGDGIALLGGRGKVEIEGNGILWVKDVSGNANIKVEGYGEKKEFADGWIQYSGFRGEAKIEGSRIRVIVAGVDIDLFAEGRGRVMLWGHGTYELNNETGRWESERLGKRLRLTSEDAPVPSVDGEPRMSGRLMGKSGPADVLPAQ